MTRKKLLLTQTHNPKCDLAQPTGPSNERYVYHVDKVTNSTRPQVYQTLSREEVDALCADDTWEVQIS